MAKFVSYDIKGIQRYIYSVPRLKYIIGGSLMISEFDEKIKTKFKNEFVFAAGGKGVVELLNNLKEEDVIAFLKSEASSKGLDLRINFSGDFKDVSGVNRQNEKLFPFTIKEDLSKEHLYPCKTSGMYPVKGANSEHQIMLERRKKLKDEKFKNQFYDLNNGDLPNTYNYEFFSNVDAKDSENHKEGQAGSNALGRRNRWAIIAMDGNDLGSQSRSFNSTNSGDFQKWSKEMSANLSEVTKDAFTHGLRVVLAKWWKENGNQAGDFTYLNEDGEEKLVVPFRPLIVGGDDILLICHCDYAFHFVEEVSREFTKLSKDKAIKHGGKLWPATNDSLTISAGVAFTGVSYPLHTSIPYAEALLGSAKAKFRNKDENIKEPSPAAIDWENITETFIDNPGARRKRDLVFKDGDLNDLEIRLTQKPYKMSDFFKLRKEALELESLPKNFHSELKSILTSQWAVRVMRLTSYNRSANAKLKTMLNDLIEQNNKINKYWFSGKDEKSGKEYQSTNILDMVSILDEVHRLEQVTT